jgi:integrase/recombinase XerD
MERSYASARALVRRAGGPLATHLDGYVSGLIDCRYTASVVYIKARHAAAFGRWLAKRRFAVADLGEGHVELFQHRARPIGRRVAPKTLRSEQREVLHLLQFLRTCGVCRPVLIQRSSAEQQTVRYAAYLRSQQGLTRATVERYEAVALQFLRERFGCSEVDLHALGAEDVISFIRRRAKELQPLTLKCVGTALRSFLRYVQYCGETAVVLEAAVPAVATWVTTPALPKAIAPEHAQRAIDSCDPRAMAGLRDRAVLLVLARLGLRAHEIIALQLDDCDWDRGHLRVRGKGGREVLLPMPQDVGEAIGAYLQHSRPASEDRHLFLRAQAPYRGLTTGSDAIGAIVRYALERAHVMAPHRGSHQFRHALAVRLLQAGASFPEIGEVLRHRSPQSTSIYARVDLSALRPLALPWPGGA